MGFTGAEPILDALKTSLAARMPARLDALEAALLPALTLADIAEFDIGDRDVVEAFPACVITVRPPATVEHEKLARMNIGWPVELRLMFNDETPEDLERRMLRYLRATLEALVDAETAGEFPFTWSLTGQSIEPTPQRRGPQDMLERDVTISMTCWAAEER